MSDGIDLSLYTYPGTEHPTGLSYALGTYTNPFMGIGLDVWNNVLDGIRQIEGVPSYGVLSLLPSYGGQNANVPESVGRAAASDTLAYWVQQTGGNIRDALAIYNGGPGNPNYGYADSVLRSSGTTGYQNPACQWWDIFCWYRQASGLGTYGPNQGPGPGDCAWYDVPCLASRAIATWWAGSSTRVIIFTVAILAALIALFGLFQKVPTEIAVRGLTPPRVKVRT